MKKVVASLVMFLVATLFSSVVFAGYTVKAGDTLSGIAKKNGVTLSILKSANPQIKNANHILIGQSIYLPEKGMQAVAKTKPVSIDGMIWKRVGADPYQGTAEWAIDHFDIPVSVKEATLRNIATGNFQWVNVENGQKLGSVTFGKNRIATNVLTEWGKNQEYAARNFGVGDYVVARVLWCGNFVWWKKQSVLSEIPQKKETPGESKIEPFGQTKLPPIFKEVPVEKKCVTSEHEFDAGGGIWRNQDNSSRGDWWFLQYKWYLESCENQIRAFGGTLTPVVGVFAKGDRGNTDAGYDWNNFGIGPQAGFMWNGQTVKGYPQQIQFMLRAIYFYMHGENGWSGYSKEQEHILVGYYLEYIRRFQPEYMVILYSEGWFDVNKVFKSTWSGDRVNDLTQFTIGAKLHKDLTDRWAMRIGPQLGYQVDENRFGASFIAELRYDEWLIFGPSFDYCISSDVVNEAGGWVAGVFARVELHKQITKQYTEYRMEKVVPSDKQLLEY
jgi:LysM repeat protein